MVEPLEGAEERVEAILDDDAVAKKLNSSLMDEVTGLEDVGNAALPARRRRSSRVWTMQWSKN